MGCIPNNMHFDILIIGGGLIGNSLAASLSDHPLRVGILEARESSDLSYDDGRSIALNYGSRRIFDTLGVNFPSTPIHEIHVSNRGHFGKTRLRACDYNVDALGSVVGINPLSRALLDANKEVEFICPASVTHVDLGDEQSTLSVSVDGVERTITTKLLIAADGVNSSIRKLLGIDATVWDYKQHAVVCNVELDRSHQHIAFERFTDLGPFAILPLSHKTSALIWAVKNNKLPWIKSLGDDDFLTEAQTVFGYQLGRFKAITSRYYFPLSMHRIKKEVMPGVIFIGNAAQSLHPFAAQGFNVGLRDVAVLAELIVGSTDIRAATLLEQYSAWRKNDKREMVMFTDGVTRLFSHDFLPYNFGRNIGLLATDLFSPFKKLLAKRSLGISGRSSKLVRGIPL